jgi:hypothetical protein
MRKYHQPKLTFSSHCTEWIQGRFAAKNPSPHRFHGFGRTDIHEGDRLSEEYDVRLAGKMLRRNPDFSRC